MSEHPPESLRRQVHDVIFGHRTGPGKTFDVILLILILCSVATISLESVASIRANHAVALRTAEWVFTIIFTVEYVVRLWASTAPLRYARSFYGIIDLVSVLPAYLTLLIPHGPQYLVAVRVLRFVRMFRVLKMARHVTEANIIVRAIVASRAKITVFLIALLSAVFVLGTLMYLVEGEASGFTSIPKSVYWAIVTITTVGYGDVSPITPLGQLISAITMIGAYGLIAVPTGIVGAEIYREAQKDSTAKLKLQLTTDGRACPDCSARDHRTGAKFCYSCGSKLDV